MVALTGIEWVSAQLSWVQFALSCCDSVLLVQPQIIESAQNRRTWLRGGSAPTASAPQRTFLNGGAPVCRSCRPVVRPWRHFRRNSDGQEAR